MQKRKMALLTMVHFFNDSYASFLPPLLPLLILSLDLSITSATFLVSVFIFSSSITQPIFGYLADRVTRRYFVVLAPALSAMFMSSIGLVSTYWMVAVMLMLGGLGIAAFHPQTVALAGAASGSRRGLGVSIFISGGTVGYALGPLWIVYLVTRLGLDKSFYAAIPGLLFVGFLLRGNVLRERLETSKHKLSLARAFKPQARAIGLLFAIVVLWTATRMGFIALLPILYSQRGLSLLSGGAIITVYVFSGAIGGVLGGHLSDRLGRRMVILSTLILSVPFSYAFVHARGPLSVVLLAIAGMFLMGSSSVVIAMAQEMIPENVGTASSVVMGLAWGIGGLLVVVSGLIAEKLGLPAALVALALLPLLGAILAYFLPSREGFTLPSLVSQEG